MSASLAPASDKRNGPAKIITILERLASHYPAQQRTEAADKLRWQDWLEDLADKPLDLIEDAATAWRRSPNAWFPTPGQFLAIVNPALVIRKSTLRIVERHLDKPDHEPPPAQADEALSDEERAELAQILTRRPGKERA